MTQRLDLVLRQCRLRARPEETVDIGIAGDRIALIAPHLDDEAAGEVDAGGSLVTGILAQLPGTGNTELNFVYHRAVLALLLLARTSRPVGGRAA